MAIHLGGIGLYWSATADADGFFVFLQPLSVVKHDVHLKVILLNPIKPNYNYNTDWTYHLNVVP